MHENKMGARFLFSRWHVSQLCIFHSNCCLFPIIKCRNLWYNAILIQSTVLTFDKRLLSLVLLWFQEKYVASEWTKWKKQKKNMDRFACSSCFYDGWNKENTQIIRWLILSLQQFRTMRQKKLLWKILISFRSESSQYSDIKSLYMHHPTAISKTS